MNRNSTEKERRWQKNGDEVNGMKNFSFLNCLSISFKYDIFNKF